MLSTLRLYGPSAVGLALVLGAALTTPGWLDAGVDGGAAGDVPITTDSDEVRRLYVEGRDLWEELHTPDARRRFLRPIELLLTMGRHEESIALDEEALRLDPGFVDSFIGIGNDLLFLGRPGEARLTFQRVLDVARGELTATRAWST